MSRKKPTLRLLGFVVINVFPNGMNGRWLIAVAKWSRRTGAVDKTLLDTSFAFDNENPCLSNWMSDVLRSYRCMENIAGLKYRRKLLPILFVAHFDTAIEHCKYFFSFVDMPLIGLVRPMEPRSNTVHVGNIKRAPCAGCGESFAANDFHGSSLYDAFRRPRAGQTQMSISTFE